MWCVRMGRGRGRGGYALGEKIWNSMWKSQGHHVKEYKKGNVVKGKGGKVSKGKKGKEEEPTKVFSEVRGGGEFFFRMGEGGQLGVLGSPPLP